MTEKINNFVERFRTHLGYMLIALAILFLFIVINYNGDNFYIRIFINAVTGLIVIICVLIGHWFAFRNNDREYNQSYIDLNIQCKVTTLAIAINETLTYITYLFSILDESDNVDISPVFFAALKRFRKVTADELNQIIKEKPKTADDECYSSLNGVWHTEPAGENQENKKG